MNERIRELAEQAAHDTRAMHNNAYWWMQEQMAEDATWREKFAELIVQECISICDGNGEYKNHTDTLFGQGFAEGIRISKAQIRQHFGVEE